MDPDLVHEPCGEELLVDVGAHEPDPLVARRVLRPCQGRLDPVGDEREERVGARHGPVGDDEAGHLAEWPLPPHASIELS